ncbi:MAG: hypothetical protein LBI96_08145, partial [Odoribacteraceae bacterium]|nr:hypothetical protein [Odoribacteraceae bacterium]
MNRKVIFWVCCFCASLPSRGDELSFRHYTARDGLSTNDVLCMIQDASGRVWCGTSDGLSRFDSREFKTFRHVAGDDRSLGNNTVHSLHEAANGEIWVGTENGVYRHDPATGFFAPFPLHPLEQATGGDDAARPMHKNIVYSIKEDRDGQVWITAYGNGLYRYDPDTRTLHHYTKDGREEAATIPSDLSTKILVDRGGTVWVATNGAGVYRYVAEEERFERVPLRDEATGREARYIYALCEDDQGNICACDNALFKYDPIRRTTRVHLVDELQSVHFITSTRTGSLYIGSDAGLTIYHPDGSAETHRHDARFPRGLSDTFVYSILEDNEGGLWVGTYCGGLNYLAPGSDAFEFHAPSDAPGGLHGKIVSEFREGADGSLWIGTEDDGLYHFSPRNGRFTPVYLGDDSRGVKVQALLVDGNDLWVGTYARGIFRKNTATGRLTHYLDSSNIKNVYSLYKDSAGR